MTVPQAAQLCSSAAVWFGVRLSVISSASVPDGKIGDLLDGNSQATMQFQ